MARRLQNKRRERQAEGGKERKAAGVDSRPHRSFALHSKKKKKNTKQKREIGRFKKEREERKCLDVYIYIPVHTQPLEDFHETLPHTLAYIQHTFSKGGDL